MLSRIVTLVLLAAAIPCMLHAQATPTASRTLSFQAGAGVSLSDPDYGDAKTKGFSAFAGVDFGAHLGIEADYHNLNIITPEDIGEASYLLGVRYKLNKGHLHPYLRISAGLATITYNKGFYASTTSTTYKIAAFAGGLDYRVKPNITIRAFDFEYQDWVTFSPNNLTPWIATVGVAYNFK